MITDEQIRELQDLLLKNSLPHGLKELSNVAVLKQLAVNEACENVQHAHMQFLRAFNGSVMDAEFIKAKAQSVLDAYEFSRQLIETITKPIID